MFPSVNTEETDMVCGRSENIPCNKSRCIRTCPLPSNVKSVREHILRNGAEVLSKLCQKISFVLIKLRFKKYVMNELQNKINNKLLRKVKTFNSSKN
jgi:hypothetical protein